MQKDLVRRIRERRDAVHRRIGELRSELDMLQARADELEGVWKDLVADQRPAFKVGVSYISEPKVAITAPSGTTGLILQAMEELEDAGYEGADRAAIVAVVLRKSPKVKSNTIRVAFKRLLKQGRIEKRGNLYGLPPSHANSTGGTAA